jgi:hypothetical protein
MTRSARITTVGEPNHLEFEVRGAVGDSEAVVEFTLEAHTSILIELPPDSNWDDPGFSVVSTDVTATTGHLLKPLRFSGLITLDRYDRPQGGELTRVTARGDDPGLLAWRRREQMGSDVLTRWQDQMGSSVLRRWQEQIGSSVLRRWQDQIGSSVLRQWQDQMGSDVLKRLRQPGAQLDRTDDAVTSESDEEQSTSEDSKSKRPSEDESDEPPDA